MTITYCMTDKEPIPVPKFFVESLKSSIRDTYEYLKYWKKQEIDCTGFIDGVIAVDTEYAKKCRQKIDEYEEKLKEELTLYNNIKDLDGEQLAKYLQYRDLKKELDL